MKAIILARVSTDEQLQAGNSLPAQITRLEQYCDRNNFEIIERFVFQESAYKVKRDEFDKAIKFIESQKDKVAVCFDKVDRFSRNMFDPRVAQLHEMAVSGQIELHFASDNQIISQDQSAAEKTQFGMNLLMAKYYSDAISDNVKRAFEKKRRNGEWTGPAPYGYRNISLDKEKRTRKDIVPDDFEAAIVLDLFQKYATEEYSFPKLAEYLNDKQITTKNNKPFHTSAVHNILRNPFYYGVAKSPKYGEYPHKYQPIVPKKLWLEVERIRAHRDKNPTKSVKKQDYIFSGLLKCAKCGCAMTPEIKKGRYIYYSCTNSKGICKREYINENILVSEIQKVLSSIALNDQQIDKIVSFLKKNHEDQSLFHQNKVKVLQNKYIEIDKDLDRLLNLLIKGSITEDIYNEKHQKLKSEQAILGIELEELTQADDNYHITAKTVLNLAKRANEIFKVSEIPEKRQILRFLLQNPVVNGKNLEFTIRKPFDTIADVKGQPIGLRE